MRRIASLSLLLVCLSLVGCGSSSGGSGQTSNSSEQTSVLPSLPATLPADQGGDSSGNYQPLNLALSWSAPTARTDGESLSWGAIGGYAISYVNSSDQHFTITIDDPTQTSHTLAALAPDDYEFRIFAFDSENRLSPASPILSLPLTSFET